jgi:hypothetical protein
MENYAVLLVSIVEKASAELEPEFKMAVDESANIVHDLEFQNIIEELALYEGNKCLTFSQV